MKIDKIDKIVTQQLEILESLHQKEKDIKNIFNGLVAIIILSLLFICVTNLPDKLFDGILAFNLLNSLFLVCVYEVKCLYEADIKKETGKMNSIYLLILELEDIHPNDKFKLIKRILNL